MNNQASTIKASHAIELAGDMYNDQIVVINVSGPGGWQWSGYT